MIRYLTRIGLKYNLRGFGFLTRILLAGSIKVKNKYGVSFELDPYEKIDGCIIRYGYFDQDVLDCLIKNIGKDDVLWDIGANIGLHALTIKKIVPELECHCFEPYYMNFGKLLINKLLNGSDIICHNYALHDSIGIFELRTTPGNHGATGIFPSSGKQRTNFNICTVSGQKLIDEEYVPSPTILKIDTEGNEYNILFGLKKILGQGKVHTIIFESNYDIQKITEYLQQSNFKVSRLSAAPNYVAELQ